MPVFVKASRRSKAYTRKSPSIKSLYKNYVSASEAHRMKNLGDYAMQANGPQRAVNVRFGKLYRAIQSKGMNPSKIIANLSSGKYKLR